VKNRNRLLIRFSLALIMTIVLWHTPSTAAIIFSWDCENSPDGNLSNATVNQPFSDVNPYGNIRVSVTSENSKSGNKAIKIEYNNDEDGVELRIPEFSSTRSLYTRKHEFFAPGWEGNWPVGLKTSRYFTEGTAYHSEKMIWQTYSSSCSEQFGMGMNSAIYNLDLERMYSANQIFGNGLPYIRTGHWYKIETWMVLNSGDNIADGVLQIWIDDVQVYNSSAVVWRSTSRGAAGTGWRSMWFGGNYSGAICGNMNRTLVRYIDDLYVSSTLDRSANLPGISAPKNLRLP
jgi:hypothetical protein